MQKGHCVSQMSAGRTADFSRTNGKSLVASSISSSNQPALFPETIPYLSLSLQLGLPPAPGMEIGNTEKGCLKDSHIQCIDILADTLFCFALFCFTTVVIRKENQMAGEDADMVFPHVVSLTK